MSDEPVEPVTAARPRRRALGCLAALAALALVCALGPRPQVVAPGAPDLPTDLDAYLAAREAGFADLRPDCEARIVWRDPELKAVTEWAVVSLHGFSASRMEAAPLWAQVADALDANLYETRLAGHGRSQDAMADGTASRWLGDGQEALAIGQRLGRRVLLVGCSTGATLATWLAAEHPPQVEALVLLSPNYGVRNPAARVLSWPWAKQLVRAVEGPYRQFKIRSEAHGRYWTWRYPSPVVVEMQALVDATTALDLTHLTAPTLVIASREDRVIDPAAVEAQTSRFGGPTRLEWFTGEADPSHHVLAGDVLSPATTAPLRDLVLGFVPD